MGRPDRVVVVGAGLAGLRTVEQLRQQGYDGTLTLVGAEDRPPYDRPPLSKQVLRGETPLVHLRDPERYGELDLDLRLGTTARAVDPSRPSVDLSDGSAVAYGTLVIATGARPRTLPAAASLSGVHVLRTAADCERLRSDVASATRAVVVGAGFIGCEVAASLATLGLEVTVVEMASAPLVAVLGDRVAAHVAQLHEDHGVRFRCNAAVAGLDGDATVTAVRLADGTVVPADLVVLGLGVTPVTEWLDGSGIAVDNGVVCNEYGETGVAGVYAVGDVAGWRDPRTGRRRRFEHWTGAIEQAAVVARNILAADAERIAYTPVPYFWSDQYDVKIQSLGLPTATADVTMFRLSDRQRLAVYGEEGMFTGVVGFACPAAVMRLRSALADPTPVADVVAQVAATGAEPVAPEAAA